MADALALGELLPWLVVAVVGVPLTGILHELTHVLFIWPVALEVDYEWPQQYVEARVPDTPWRQRWASVAGVAPLITGVFVLFYLVETGNPPADFFSVEGLVQWGLWVSYSITGGISDYLPSAQKDNETTTQTDERTALERVTKSTNGDD